MKRKMFSLLLGIIVTIHAFAQQKTVTGKVTDENAQPLAGVSVLIKGATNGVSTDADGNYSIRVNQGQVLQFSFIGSETQERTVGAENVINVSLKGSSIGLQEVIATGYMTQKKADLTGAVATVSQEEISKNSYANVMQGLQGRMPGVQITTDGNPVGNVNVQIRGLTSFRAAPPLIVIDGLPTNSNLRDINPGDIASMQVLKDAASASIYGSRAASGVILIQTKSGKKGETKITYDGTVGISSFMNRIDMMNTQQYGQAFWQAAINDGHDPNDRSQIYDFDWHRDANGVAVLDQVIPREWLHPDNVQNKIMKSADTDWFEEGSQLGMQNNHQLTVLNGTEKAKTMFSVNYYDTRGTQIYTGFRRYSLRLNTDYTLIKDRLTVGENLTLSSSKINDQNVGHSLLTMPPIIPVHTIDGGWGGTAMELGMDDYNNPVRMLTQGKDNFRREAKLLGGVYANLKLFKNLNLKTLYGVDFSGANLRHIDFTWVEGGGKRDNVNGIRSFQSNALTRTWTNTLNYNVNIKNHDLSFVAGLETINFEYDDINGYRRDIEFENYDYAYLNSATGNQEANGGGDEWALVSYFSKFNYVFNQKYLLSATVRYDGSSKFGMNNRFGFFPAVSGGWRLSEEEFFKKNVRFVSDLKLRASWGRNGNSNIPTNALVNFYDAHYQSTGYGLAGNETGTLFSGYRRIHTGNQDLKWESTTQTDVGIDFGLFNGALSGSFDYFYKKTNDMLYEPPYIAAIGEGGYRWVNTANMTNKGVELILTYQNSPSTNFSYSITGNISTDRNTVDDLPEEVKYTFGGNGLDDHILGRPRNSYYGFIADGLFRSQDEVDNSPEQSGKGLGRIRYKDLNGDGRITDAHDRTWIGVSDPDFMYGANFSATFKNLDFSMFWQGVAGNIVRNDWKTYSDFWNVWTQTGFNHPTRILGAWSPTNLDSDIPALSLINPNNERGRLSTYFMESGSYLKLRHVEIGYTLPKNLIAKAGASECRIYVNAQNIVNLKKWWGDDAYTGTDPETPSKADEYSSPYLRPQMFMAGARISF